MDFYFLINKFWINYNCFLIIPSGIACINRYLHPQIDKPLLTDYITRFLLIVACLFYLCDSVVKYVIDGGETICQKAIFIHHLTSEIMIIPFIINKYVPWWTNPIGFMHGFLVFFPEAEVLNYIYAAAVLYFQYMLYQKPFVDIPYYKITRVTINGVWVFALFLMIGDCSNYLATVPD